MQPTGDIKVIIYNPQAFIYLFFDVFSEKATHLLEANWEFGSNALLSSETCNGGALRDPAGNRTAEQGRINRGKTSPLPFLHVKLAACKPLGFVAAVCKVKTMKDMIFRRPKVERITGLSRSTLYAMMAEGEFPKPIKLGKRAVGWRESDIAAWLESRTTDAA